MYEEQANLFKVLSDTHRLQILKLLIEGETCGCTLIDKMNITQPTLSYHLNMIANAGLANKVKDGTKHKYYVDKEKMNDLSQFIIDIMQSSMECDAEI